MPNPGSGMRADPLHQHPCPSPPTQSRIIFFSQDPNWEMAVMIPTCQEGAPISALGPVLVSNTL